MIRLHQLPIVLALAGAALSCRDTTAPAPRVITGAAPAQNNKGMTLVSGGLSQGKGPGMKVVSGGLVPANRPNGMAVTGGIAAAPPAVQPGMMPPGAAPQVPSNAPNGMSVSGGLVTGAPPAAAAVPATAGQQKFTVVGGVKETPPPAPAPHQ